MGFWVKDHHKVAHYCDVENVFSPHELILCGTTFCDKYSYKSFGVRLDFSHKIALKFILIVVFK